MVNIEINGIPLQVEEGSMVIEAADNAGITIPRFCYHKKLSVAANCRMCLVEVEKAPKPLPACATPVTDGMKVFTKSPLAIDAQKSVMEFLLINHPLDCPICDQGGECDLQDIAVGYGKSVSRYTEGKRVVADKNIGSLIATEMTRCIHCTRCVRFGQEIAGIMELGATGRGEHTRIGTYVERTVSSEMSGNVVDLCPVGALTSKPYRYSGRPWENRQMASVAPHDCVGSNVNVEVRRDKVMRVLPRENEMLNEVWLSDRDRYSYTALYGEDRLTTPMIKQGEQWHEVDWETALGYAVDGIKAVRDNHGIEQLGALVSPSSTTEEMYLLQKLLRGIGCNNIDHRLRQSDFSDQDIAPAFPSLGQGVAELENNNAVLLIGSWTRKDQPIIGHRLRKAAKQGANIMAINSLDYDFNLPLAENIVVRPSQMSAELAAVCKALATLTGKSLPDDLKGMLENIDSHDGHLEIAKHLHTADNAAVLLGTQAHNQPNFADLRALAGLVADLSGSRLGYLTEGANAAGAWLAGAVSHRGAAGASSTAGKTAADMIHDGINGLIMLGIEPERDCANSGKALSQVKDADFVVSLSSFVTETMKDYADVLLPVTPYTETSGTYINVEGQWQSFAGSVQPLGEARPAWKVLRVLGNLFRVDGFDYVTSEEVRDELKALCSSVTPAASHPWRCPSSLAADNQLVRIGHLPIYSVDALVRRSQPLQQTNDAMAAVAYMNASTSQQLDVQAAAQVLAIQGDYSATLDVMIDEAIPDNCVMIPMAVEGSSGLGDGYGEIEVRPV
ncbi:MAG: NADH-quinone oxidoreductase subunit NuoG [Thioalkalispiraceae bacterium]|jgi:NADH-quinone oxidoreductase subunit G